MNALRTLVRTSVLPQMGSSMRCMSTQGLKGFSEHEKAAEDMYFTKEDQQSTLSLDFKWKTRTLPSLLTACTQSHLPQDVIQSIIEEHEERALSALSLYEERESSMKKELQLKEYQLKFTILEYLRAQGKLDARGLLEYAQRVLAISEETVTAQDGQHKWSGVFKDKPRLLNCIQEKLNLKNLGAGKAASMVSNAYSLVSGAIHSNKFIQTETDAVIISEVVLPRDHMLILECIALEVEVPYKIVYTKDDTKSAF